MNKKLVIKVCGMKDPENMKAVSNLEIDFLGYIFYPPSKRFVGGLGDEKLQKLFTSKKKKTGVFVNEKEERIDEIFKKYNLDFIQLHGNESPEFCYKMKNQGKNVIKAFHVDETFDFNFTSGFQGTSDFFLFDTKSINYGGTGKKFNWKILENYSGNTPFFLSGGIKPEDAKEIKEINHPKLFGIDLNSGFEDRPGLKNIKQLEQFLNRINEISG